MENDETMEREYEAAVAETDSDVDTLRDKIVRLTKRLTDVEAAKGASNKAYNDEIKDIKVEIKMTLDIIEELTGATA